MSTETKEGLVYLALEQAQELIATAHPFLSPIQLDRLATAVDALSVFDKNEHALSMREQTLRLIDIARLAHHDRSKLVSVCEQNDCSDSLIGRAVYSILVPKATQDASVNFDATNVNRIIAHNTRDYLATSKSQRAKLVLDRLVEYGRTDPEGEVWAKLARHLVGLLQMQHDDSSEAALIELTSQQSFFVKRGLPEALASKLDKRFSVEGMAKRIRVMNGTLQFAKAKYGKLIFYTACMRFMKQ